MATSAFRVYNSAKKYLLTGGIDLDTSVIMATLIGNGGNASDYTLSVIGSVSGSASGGGFAAKSLTGVTVGSGASAKVIKFDASDLVWTASGSAIDSIKHLVLYVSGLSAGAHKLLGWVLLTSTAFTLSTNNTLTIQWNASGIFTLSGGVT